MPRIKTGAIILEAFGLNIYNYLELLHRIRKEGYDAIYVSVSPSYIVGTIIDNKNMPMNFTIAPLAFIFTGNTTVIRSICGQYDVRCYEVLRDAWIDYREIYLDDYISLLDKVREAIENEKETSFSALLEKTMIKIHLYKDKCDDVYVMEGLERYNYSWKTLRKEFMDEKYRKALYESTKSRPLVYTLVYVSKKNQPEPSVQLRVTDKRELSIEVPIGCEKLIEILPWLILDVIL